MEVYLIYDPWVHPAQIKVFARYVDAGGKVAPFITSRDMIRKTRLNYHLHRKIVVIDGKIGWTGGFNVGDQYLNVTENLVTGEIPIFVWSGRPYFHCKRYLSWIGMLQSNILKNV